MEKEKIREKIKAMLVERLMLTIDPSEINDNAPLFDTDNLQYENAEAEVSIKEFQTEEEGLGLDSIDALEVVVGIKDLYDIQIIQGENVKIFYSVNTLVDYVYDELNKKDAE